MIGEAVAAAPGARIELAGLETNIVVFHLEEGAPGAPEVLERAKAQDVLVMAFGPRTIRAVTHLGVSREDCALAAEVLAAACAA